MSSPTPPTGPASTTALRAAVVVVLFLTLAAAGLLAMDGMARMNRADMAGPVPPLFAPAVVTLMAGIALAAVVEGLARVAGRPAGEPGGGGDHDAAAPAVNRLAAAVAELRAALPGLLADLRPPARSPFADAPIHAEDDPAATEAPVDPSVVKLGRVVQLLEELKELALLDDTTRQARGHMAKERRKSSRLEEAALLIHRREWEQADALLTLVESLFPGDPEVLARRNELDDARGMARDAEWQQLARHVEDLMALSRYDEAAAAVGGFRSSHPNHADAAALAAGVASDRDAYTERTVTALYGEIKTAVDARQWRMALDGAQRFLHRFPDHPRSERIRQQVRVIQKNAEIEERHEQEDRIKELARGGRFAEAADLCQDLLERFPDSPQAPSLQALLPKLRDRSAVAEPAVE